MGSEVRCRTCGPTFFKYRTLGPSYSFQQPENFTNLRKSYSNQTSYSKLLVFQKFEFVDRVVAGTASSCLSSLRVLTFHGSYRQDVTEKMITRKAKNARRQLSDSSCLRKAMRKRMRTSKIKAFKTQSDVTSFGSKVLQARIRQVRLGQTKISDNAEGSTMSHP